MADALTLAVAQGLGGLSAACIIFALTNRASAKVTSSVAFASAALLSILMAHWSMDTRLILATVPLFAAAAALCAVNAGREWMPDRDRRRVERFLAWDRVCTCGR